MLPCSFVVYCPLRRAPKWFTALECDERGAGGKVGEWRGLCVGGKGVIGDRLRLGFLYLSDLGS